MYVVSGYTDSILNVNFTGNDYAQMPYALFSNLRLLSLINICILLSTLLPGLSFLYLPCGLNYNSLIWNKNTDLFSLKHIKFIFILFSNKLIASAGYSAAGHCNQMFCYCFYYSGINETHGDSTKIWALSVNENVGIFSLYLASRRSGFQITNFKHTSLPLHH